MFVHALWVLLQAQVPGANEHRIGNIFRPLATPATDEKTIAIFTLAITGVIFVVVAGLITYTIWRFRRKSDDELHQEPPQVYGSNQIEVAWTVIPILIVFVLIGVSARVIASVQNASPPKSMLKVKLIGHQWWWEVQYPDYGIVTANEIHVPIAGEKNTATYLQLESQDVIHSFWVPQLAGKTDLIPNRTNYMWIDPREPGEYLGNCAEYCGTQHANMLLRVYVDASEDFERWLANERKNTRESDDAEVRKGKEAFFAQSCINCHRVRGTPANGTVGPDLTHLMSRDTLASGMIPNDRKGDNLRAWIVDPHKIKPGCLMPPFSNLSERDLDGILRYLNSLE